MWIRCWLCLKIVLTALRFYFNMGKKDKKKGKGAEKTVAKTEKKLSQKLKKELKVIGEDDIEKIIAEIEEDERRQKAVTEKVVQPPSNRVNFTLTPHPDKDELILFGGEFFNGQKTRVFNDLYFYNIQRNEWTQVKSPNGPAPRCSHQAVAISADRGQFWIFGGEFISPSQAQFYHYNDLWVYYIAQKKWERINVPGGPSSRSGHRMVCVKKQLIVFGGFHESHQDFKYYNDVYAFSLENRTWKKLDVSGSPPSPRSGFQMFPLSDGKILLFGGYSKLKVKKDVDKGVIHNDMFLLSLDKADKTGLKWKWLSIKPGGIRPSLRSGISAAIAPGNKIYTFGGVLDQDDDDEDLVSEFYNDLNLLDADKTVWRYVTLSGKKDSSKQKRRRNKDCTEVEEMEDVVEGEGEGEEAESSKTEKIETPMVVADDGVFTVTVGPALTSEEGEATSVSERLGQTKKSRLFTPSPRINSGMAIKHGVLYLFGGIFEDGDKQFTYADFYSLDLHKLEEWQIIIPPEDKHEWIQSTSESEDDDDDEEEEDDDNDEEVEGDEEIGEADEAPVEAMELT